MKYENLVLSGGGVKGYTYIGVMKAFEELNIKEKFKIIVGSSIGSFFALLMVLGYTSDKLITVFSKMNISFGNLVSITENNIDDVLSNFVYSYGMDSGEKIHNIIKIFIKNKIENSEISFKELYDYTNVELTIVLTNLTQNTTKYCNYINTPDMKVHLAVRASISLPFIFNPVIIDDIFYIDGGITNNLPIDYFSETDIKNTLGISLTSLKTDKINSLTQYILGIFKCYIGFSEIEKINKYKDNILIIQQECSSIETEMTETEIQCLINEGYLSTLNHLNTLKETTIENESNSPK